MPPSGTKAALKHLLRGLSSVLGIVAGLSFFFGGRAIHELGRVDRTLAEIIVIALAFVCLIGIAVAKHVIDDIEWREANELAAASAAKQSADSAKPLE
jgi:hypothetical protein